MYKPLLTISETATFLKTSTLKIRFGIINKIFPFGVSIPSCNIDGSINKNGRKQYSFHTSTKQVEEYIGITYEEFLKNKEKK